MVRNLVGNALKFTEAGWVRAQATIAAEALVVRIADSGIGIAPEHQETILEMFRRFVEQLGGTVAVESVPGRGAAFTVILPRTAAVSSSRAA